MYKSTQVVDDFYADPERVRAVGLERSKWYPKSEDGRTFDHESENFFYTPALAEQLQRLVGSPIDVDPARMGFGVFAFTGAHANVELTTHFDDTDWSAIIYLVPPTSCQGGLSFYRHRASGLDGPPTPEQAAELGYNDRDEWLREVYFPAKLDPDAWEETSHVEMRFNRLVLLRGSRVFHRASSGFGDTPEGGRLTQRFFFNDAKETV